jgi:hypothetical protein
MFLLLWRYYQNLMQILVPEVHLLHVEEQLIARFGETTDHRQAFFILRNRRQKPNETIQAFSDDLYTLSRKAYPNLRGHEAFIETELIEIFTPIWSIKFIVFYRTGPSLT